MKPFKPLLAVLWFLLIGTGTVAVAAASGHKSQHPTVAPAALRRFTLHGHTRVVRTGAAHAAADLRSRFRLLRVRARVAAAGTGLPAAESAGLQNLVTRLGLEPSAAREAVGLATAVWIIPTTSGEACVLGDGVGLACVPESYAAQGGLLVERVDPPSGTTTIAGLMPDGVSQVNIALADGGLQSVVVHNNGYSAVVHGTPVEATGSDGGAGNEATGSDGGAGNEFKVGL